MTVPDFAALFPGTAVFSVCERYRYALERTFARGDRAVLFIGLNPSTATAETNDPTVRRAIGFARAWRFDRLLLGNVFAFRSTDPRGLRTVADPIGPDNDRHLLELANRAERIVCAWGVHATLNDRERKVVELLRDAGFEHRLCHLGVTKDGHPKHPLYLSSSTRLQPWRIS